jgi:ClpP class serine protease
VDGVKPTEEALDYVRETVEDLNALFRRDVSSGRNLVGGELDEVSSGRTWIAGKAVGMGLVDEIGTLESAHAELAAVVDQDRKSNRAEARTRLL